MPIVSITTADGIASTNITALKMSPLGGATLEYARAVVADVQSDTTGQFVLDITSAGFIEPPNVQAQTNVNWGPVANTITSAMLAQAVVANISSVTATQIRGFVTQPNTVVVGGLAVKLASTPVTVSLLITGKTAAST